MFNVDFEEIKKSGVKGVLIDLDNTLYAYQPCHEHALKVCADNFRAIKPLSIEEFKKLYSSSQDKSKKWTVGQAACHSRFFYFQRMAEEIFGRTDVDFSLNFEKLYWQSFFEKMTIFPGVVDFLEQCQKNKIKICLITDLTARIQFEKIQYLKIADYFDFVVSSEEAGHEKPHEDIFRLALEKMAMKPEEVVMIGDDYKKDLAGAAKLGIKTILVNNQS